MSDVLVVGCGLLGTSVGLALRGSELADVTVSDVDPHAERVAVGRGAGRAWDKVETARIVVVAVPPSSISVTLIELQGRDIGVTYTHVSSVQSHVQSEVEMLSSDSSQIVGGHPLAGREVSGPEGAIADLFVGRPWAVCPTPKAAAGAVEDVVRLAALCGALPVLTSPAEHDAAVALLSHLPQVVSSGLAGLLAEPSDDVARLPAQLSGPGLADTTRLAASSPALWSEILAANAAHVAPPLRRLAANLEALADTLTQLAEEGSGSPDVSARAEIEAFLHRGNLGRDQVPVKRGELSGAFAGVRVELADEPGQLAELFIAAGEAGVNVEDVRVEHVPGRPRGLIELLVEPGVEGGLREALRTAGWQVVSSTH
ncbi:MAG: prephenate dehydrogenase [Actinomycetota bacterium]|nr:prephenate dehydrogenase [Actinomycetota bacterium]